MVRVLIEAYLRVPTCHTSVNVHTGIMRVDLHTDIASLRVRLQSMNIWRWLRTEGTIPAFKTSRYMTYEWAKYPNGWHSPVKKLQERLCIYCFISLAKS